MDVAVGFFAISYFYYISSKVVCRDTKTKNSNATALFFIYCSMSVCRFLVESKNGNATWIYIFDNFTPRNCFLRSIPFTQRAVPTNTRHDFNNESF